MHPSKTSAAFFFLGCAWSFVVRWACWLEADHVHVNFALRCHSVTVQPYPGRTRRTRRAESRESSTDDPAPRPARARRTRTADAVDLSRASSAHALVAFKFQPKPTGRRSACRLFFSGNRSQTFTVFLPAEYVTTRKLAVPALTSRTASSRAPLSLPPDSSARQTGYAGREVRKNREAHEARTSLRPADRAVWRR